VAGKRGQEQEQELEKQEGPVVGVGEDEAEDEDEHDNTEDGEEAEGAAGVTIDPAAAANGVTAIVTALPGEGRLPPAAPATAREVRAAGDLGALVMGWLQCATILA
jgi:hypothetical protein